MHNTSDAVNDAARRIAAHGEHARAPTERRWTSGVILEAVFLRRGTLEELSVAGEAGPPETCRRRAMTTWAAKKADSGVYARRTTVLI